VDDGTTDDHKIICGWHNCEFDMHTGESYGYPCIVGLRTYTPLIKDGAIYFNGEPRPLPE
jgi:nitrite reductase/ring-hydroxylating ferredoxin subunit